MSKKRTPTPETPNVSTTTTPRTLQYIHPNAIVRGANPGRWAEAPTVEAVQNIADSIAQHGQLNPVIVRKSSTTPDKFDLIAGFTRTAACEKLQRDVWCEVVECDDDSALDRSVEENMKRNDLTFIDTASIMERYANRGKKNTEIAAKLGCTPAWVTNCRKLLKLPKTIQDAISRGAMTGYAGVMLTKLKDPDEVMKCATDAIVIDMDREQLKSVGVEVANPKAGPQEQYDSRKIVKYVQGVLKAEAGTETPPPAEGAAPTDGTPPAEGTAPAEPQSKIQLKKQAEQLLSVFTRTIEHAQITTECRELLSDVVSLLNGEITMEEFEVSLAGWAGFQTSELYPTPETPAAAPAA